MGIKTGGYGITDNGPGDDGRRRLARVTGIAGLVTMILVFVPVIARSGREPGFDGTTEEIAAFFQSVDTPLAEFGSFLFTLGMIAFLWFVIGLSVLLRTAEREPAWRSVVAASSGVVLVALVLAGNWDAAAFRAADLDPQIARYAFDAGNVSFANGWVAMGSFAVCCGWLIVSSGILPRWLGWWAVASGLGLAASRAVWTSEVWMVPYGMFWLWVVVLSVLLLRGRAGVLPEVAGKAEA